MPQENLGFVFFFKRLISKGFFKIIFENYTPTLETVFQRYLGTYSHQKALKYDHTHKHTDIISKENLEFPTSM